MIIIVMINIFVLFITITIIAAMQKLPKANVLIVHYEDLRNSTRR